MSTEIDNKRKSRKVLRGLFTRAVNEFQISLTVEELEEDTIKINYELIGSRFDELMVLDAQIYELMLSDATEEELAMEISASDGYQKKFMTCKLKFNRFCNSDSDPNGQSERLSVNESISGRRKFKLPQIQFKHYDGSIKDWLSFWAQFKKIHEDAFIDKADKIEYLIQATLPSSRARQLVESYPAMSENYDKIIDSMQSRFGREDLQIEVYVRELLKIILKNSAASKQNIDIATLYDKIETQLRALETLGITSDKCSAMLFPLIESCLPHDLLRVWQRSAHFHGPSGLEEGSAAQLLLSPLEERLKNLMLFLRNEVENEQRIALAVEGFGLSDNRSSAKPGLRGDNSSFGTRNSPRKFEGTTAMGLVNAEGCSCLFCGGTHGSEACFKAQRMTYAQKRELLSKAGACFKCLKVGHNSKRCRGRLRCVVCSRSHVALMCSELPTNKDSVKQLDDPKQRNASTKDQTQSLANQTSSTHVFLQTLKLTLIGPNGSKVVRALIDTGSQKSYILTETAVQLGFRAKGREKMVHGLFGGMVQQNTHNRYEVTISRGTFSYTFEALDQLKICGDVAPVFYGPWIEQMKILKVRISDFGQSGPVELLLGADIVGSLYTGKRHELPCGLVAMETLVGWTLMGKALMNNARSDAVVTTLNLFVNSASISDLWELEAIGIKEPSDMQTKKERAMAAKQLFLETVRLDEDGRYEVRLPWLEGHPPLGSNFRIAQKRLDSTVRKLKSDNLFASYGHIFRDWEEAGIIEQINSPKYAEGDQCHFLPHRAVVKESSATTKIRPVFDASAHEVGRPSINHCLEKGLNLIELIPSMLMRFRQNKIGVISDIAKAFLQIGINEDDRDFLQFLWVDSQGHQINFRHRRVVFGLNSSPFLLGATLEYHLEQSLKRCDTQAAEHLVYSRDTLQKLKRSFYVDNCVTSLPDEESVTKFIKESTAVMAEGKFDLRGWERTHCSESKIVEAPCPVLGLNWHAQKDVLVINTKFLEGDIDVENMVVTKRQILSSTQKVFDPIGYTCPAVLAPKLMLQNLWKEQLTWDQPVDDAVAQAFKIWIKDLPNLSCIKIPRWIGAGDTESKDLSLHTFCDASKNAYACVVFLRVNLRGRVSVFLLAAKTRVAPLKKSGSKMTIPRLELLAATIGARLYAHVCENLEGVINCYFWSDSSTVISWIERKEEWGVFVWNRTEEIRKLTPADKWNHLPGALNPADLPSRGCSPKQLVNSRWWEGPEWLYGKPDTWPTVTPVVDENEINAERKKKLVTTLLSCENSPANSVDWHLEYFSKYDQTVRMIAWIFRFIYNCKHPERKQNSELTAEEHDKAEKFLLKLVQQASFSTDDSRIRGLAPFLDEDGVIRLKSRVANRKDADTYRFPVVLPAKHSTVKRLILNVHVKSCHVGTQGLLSILRERFWILGGRRTIRSATFECVVCRRHNAKPLVVESPPLPLDRVRDAVAFEVTGVDFAGPLYLKDGTKTWICLFTCAIFRAVHLELTTSLSTSSFMQALRRFVARRGRPKTIYSDNGTNFVGTENSFANLDWDVIARETAVQRICWKFNPPTAAWWGGFWERLIGVLKRLLRKVLGRSSLDYESLLTLLYDCEAIVNARPLTYLSEDPNELIALTPSLFLRDQAEYGLPDCDAVDNASLNRKVRKIQTLRENLRVRFRSEYLGQLKLVNDKRTTRSATLGELVLVGSDNAKRLDWPIGRIVEILPGKDGPARLVKVQTSRGLMLRPIQRLFPLECCSVPECEAMSENGYRGSSKDEETNPTGGAQDLPDFKATSQPADHADIVSAVVPKVNETHSNKVSEKVTGVSAEARAEVPKVKVTSSGRTSKMPQRFL